LRPNWSSTRDPAGLLALAALVPREQLDDLLAHLVEVGAELDEDLGGDALALADEAEQDVLGPDVRVPQLEALSQRVLQDLLRPRREGDVSGRSLLPLSDDLLHLLAHGDQRDVEVLERLGGETFALVDEAQQDVLGADVVVVEHPRLFLREHHHPSGPICEPFEHRQSSLPLSASRLLPRHLDGMRVACQCPPASACRSEVAMGPTRR
jgi:hypothetical protein